MKPAPAFFVGIQEGWGHLPSIELYNLTEDVGIHPAGSTVSRQTLEQHGYSVPPVPSSALQEASS
jgi:hypothetical protein